MHPEEIGERFARALAAKDAETLLALVAPDVDVKALTPGRPWETTSADELVHDILLGRWYEETDRIVGVESVETGAVADRHRLTYRFRVDNPDGRWVVEQHGYYDVTDGRISLLRLLCSGFRPVPEG